MTAIPPQPPEEPTPADGTEPSRPEPSGPGPGGQDSETPGSGTPGPGAYPPGAGGYAPGQGDYTGAGGYGPGPGGYTPGGYGPGPGAYGRPGSGAPTGHQGYSAPLMSPADQRMWAVLSHLSGFVSNFILPLVLWLILRERGAFVEDQTKEALNYQITLIILGVVFTVVSILTLGIGAILFLYYLAAIVFMILAAVAASRGEAYRYPLCLRLVK
ncbi:MAG: DUF4870 domain-containing protein [Georgenia sp.]